jgi:nucleoside-triphosphatase
MELHSNEFQHCIQQLLASPSVRVIGAITSPIYGHRVPFCDDITSRPEVSVWRITKKNRDAVYDEMLTKALSLAGV